MEAAMRDLILAMALLITEAADAMERAGIEPTPRLADLAIEVERAQERYDAAVEAM